MTGSADIKFKASFINDCYVIEEADEYFLPLPDSINGHDVVVIHPKKIEISNITFLFDDINKCWMPLDAVPFNLQLPKYKYFYPIKTKIEFEDINTDFKEPPIQDSDFSPIESSHNSKFLSNYTGDGYDLLIDKLSKNQL